MRAIIAREFKADGGKERNWYPVHHAIIEHVRCGGAIVEGACSKCETPYSADMKTEYRAACRGIRLPI
mgnify:CR=1